MGKGKGCCGKNDDEKSSDKSKFKSSTDGTGENAILAVSRCLTDPHMLIVFICFLCASAALLYTAYNQGEIERIKYGFDYRGKSCGRDDLADYKHQFWPNVLYYKQLGPVCMSDCPTTPDIFDGWPDNGTLAVVCTCSAKVAEGINIDTGSVESYTVAQSMNEYNTSSTLGQMCNAAEGSKLGYYRGTISVDSTSNDFYKYLPPSYINPFANEYYESTGGLAGGGKLNIPICNLEYRTKEVLQRCVPWLDYSTMKHMFCGIANDYCPDDDLAEEFEGVAQWFEEAVSDCMTAWYVIACSGLIALVIGFIYLFFMEKCATCVLITGLVGTILGTAACAAAFYKEYTVLKDRVDSEPPLTTHDEDERNMYICMVFGILFATVCGIFLCVVICFCRQVCVAAKLLECAAEAMLDMPMLVFYPIGQTFNLLFCFLIFIVGTLFIGSAGDLKYDSVYGYASIHVDSDLQGAFAFWLFAFLWSAEFLSAVGFMTVSFAFAMWFFAPCRGGGEGRASERIMEGWPIMTSVRLTLCHHLGTCAAGSLIIAVIQMLRIVLEYIDSKKKQIEEAGTVPCMCLWDFVFCCCRCCLWCMEKCMRYVNKVAYIFTVIEGDWFCSAACSAVTTIITEFSWVTVVSGLASCMLFFGKLMTALIVAAICGYWTSTLDVASIVVPTIFSFIIGYAIAMLFAEVYEMAIDTMLICYLYSKNHNLLDGVNLPEQFQDICNSEHAKKAEADAKKEGQVNNVGIEMNAAKE